MGAANQVTTVRTALRIFAMLVFFDTVLLIVQAVKEPQWQLVVLAALSMIALGSVVGAWWILQRGEPARALVFFYIVIFAVVGVTLPIVQGTHVLVSIGLIALVLSTAPPVLPLAQVDRWIQATVAFGLFSSIFDIILLPTQLPAVPDPNFELFMVIVLVSFSGFVAFNFRRFPVKAKLMLGFLCVATVPLGLVFYLRPLPVGTSATGQQVLALAVATGACVLAFLFGRLLATPMGSVAEAMGRFTAGDTSVRAEVRTGDEVGEVALRFNELAAELGRLLGSLRDEVANRTQKELELQAVNAALAAARDQATTANRAKSVFLANMSHELRTPLNAIIGFTELIKEETKEPAVSDDASRVLVAAQHLLGVISDVLDLSRIEAGRSELQLEDVDVVEVARDVCATVQILIERNANRLHFVSRAERLMLCTDARKLRQVLLNLLSNAAKFTHKGQVWCEIRGEPEEAPQWLFIFVRDEGIGIPADQLSNLFQPFTQIDNSSTRRFEGTGLGLAISRHFCEAMGGRISVSSEPGVGSEFVIRLPITDALMSS